MGFIDFLFFVVVEVVIICLGTGILSGASEKDSKKYLK